MSIRARLGMSLVLLVAVLLVPAVHAVVRLGELRDIAVDRRGGHAAAALGVGRMEADLEALDRLERSYVAFPDTVLHGAVLARVDSLRENLEAIERAGYGEVTPPLESMIRALSRLSERIEELVEEGDVEEATSAFGVMEFLIDQTRTRLEGAAREIDRRANADFARAEAISAAARVNTLAAMVGAVALAILFGTVGTVALTRPIRRLDQAMADVADGRFEAPEDLPYGRTDEIGGLARSFRGMSRRLADLDRMKSEFVAIVSHEMKTPAHLLQGYVALLREDMSAEERARHEETLDAMSGRAEALGKLVGRVMDVSRLDAGAYRLARESIHLRDLVADLRRSFGVMAAREGVHLEVRVEASAPETMEGDMDLLRDDLLGNLISNAVKFTPDGGEVVVTVRGSAGRVHFDVADTGPGVPEDHRPHIFEKYYQVSRSQRMGAGLGLAIVRETVELHGGTVRLLRTRRPGATFRVTLPVRMSDGESSKSVAG